MVGFYNEQNWQLKQRDLLRLALATWNVEKVPELRCEVVR